MPLSIKHIPHWIQDQETLPRGGRYFEKKNPATGETIAEIARGDTEDASIAISAAYAALPTWSAMTPIARGNILRKAATILQEQKERIGALLSLEGGLSHKQSVSEVDGIVEHAHYWANEGRRFYGHTMASKTEHRLVYTMREPIGVALVITPANTPFGGRAIMPALLAGNTVVMKPSEDMPTAPLELARALKDAGLPPGVFSVVQGPGAEAGAALVADERIDLISFTGSVSVGKTIERAVIGKKEKFVKLSLELGGKNPMVICDDADMDAALKSAVLSSFSLAGQRCAAASRLIIFDSIYDQFRHKLVERINGLKIGLQDTDDLGPLINEQQLEKNLASVQNAIRAGAILLTGGKRLRGDAYQHGYFMTPTLLENVEQSAEISQQELFGPVSILFRAKNLDEAIHIANDSPYGLTASLHTSNLHRAQEFIRSARVGVVHVNGNTYGSEPHMPFGGMRNSGNGTREAGTEALDIYTQWKTITVTHAPQKAV